MRLARPFGTAALTAAVCACVALVGARGEDKGGGDKGTRGERAANPTNDREFVLMASAGGLAEVDASNLALKQSKNEDVRRFAQHMIDDHTKANQQLNNLADRKRIPVAQAADLPHQQMLTRMAVVTGADFDRRYMAGQVRDHEQTVARFEWASKSAQDADVKSWAGKTLPTLRDHLKMARDVQDKVGGGRRDGDRARPGDVDRGDRGTTDRPATRPGDRPATRPAADRDRPATDRPATDRNKDKDTTDKNRDKDTTDKSRDKDK